MPRGDLARPNSPARISSNFLRLRSEEGRRPGGRTWNSRCGSRSWRAVIRAPWTRPCATKSPGFARAGTRFGRARFGGPRRASSRASCTNEKQRARSISTRTQSIARCSTRSGCSWLAAALAACRAHRRPDLSARPVGRGAPGRVPPRSLGARARALEDGRTTPALPHRGEPGVRRHARLRAERCALKHDRARALRVPRRRGVGVPGEAAARVVHGVHLRVHAQSVHDVPASRGVEPPRGDSLRARGGVVGAGAHPARRHQATRVGRADLRGEGSPRLAGSAREARARRARRRVRDDR